jgi:hypothetical protein
MAKILATVGTAEWDELIEALDIQVTDGLISDTIVAQIGQGVYEPKHFRFYREGSQTKRFSRSSASPRRKKRKKRLSRFGRNSIDTSRS